MKGQDTSWEIKHSLPPLMSCSGSYQLGVDGGDLEGRLLVSRCSDETDLLSAGFQTMPPTTRWHTGPLKTPDQTGH